tara:strand:- start:1518 stop:1646 length:129 start_codon:yes stop_codon:yes gene_type:complete
LENGFGTGNSERKRGGGSAAIKMERDEANTLIDVPPERTLEE